MRDLLNRLEEGRGTGITAKVLADIRDMTQGNASNDAYIEVAKALGLKRLAKKFELIKELHRLEGHLPDGLSNYRYGLYKDMMNQAKRDLSKDEYADLSAAL